MELRDYQEECVQKVVEAFHANPHGEELVVLPTAAGKTIIFAHVIYALQMNTLIIAHTDELLNQAADKYRMVKPTAVIGKVGGGVHEYGGEVTVASIDTISRPNHLKHLKHFDYQLVVIDEAHRSAAPKYQKVLQALPGAFVLKVTATPDRLDGKPIINKPALYQKDIIEMVLHTPAYLCTPRAIAIRTETNLDEIKVQGGDFNEEELEQAINVPKRNKRVVDAYLEHAPGRLAICFAVSVNHAEQLAYTFNDHGVPAVVVSGKTPLPERKKLYQQFREGNIRILCNAQVLIEGFDVPEVSCVIMARPTKSRALYVQCLDDQTEILTPNGWKSRQKIQQGDLVAGYDKETETIQWVPALNKVERPLGSDEKMFALQSPALDIRVTGGHRMVFRARNRTDINSYDQYPHGSTPWRLVEAETLAERGTEYELPISGKQAASGVPLTDDELRFIGWFLIDGTLNKANGYITIYQAAHQPHHEAIKSCLEGCGFKYTTKEETPISQYNATSNRIRYMISKGQPRGVDKHLSGWGKLALYIDKNLSPYLDNITSEQLEVLLEALHLGDGSKQNGQTWTRRSYR